MYSVKCILGQLYLFYCRIALPGSFASTVVAPRCERLQGKNTWYIDVYLGWLNSIMLRFVPTSDSNPNRGSKGGDLIGS